MNGKSKPPSVLDETLDRIQQEDHAKRALTQLISQWDQLGLAQRQLVPALANAQATLAGQNVTITGVDNDGPTGLISAIRYTTADGAAHALNIDRPQTPPPSKLILPH